MKNSNLEPIEVDHKIVVETKTRLLQAKISRIIVERAEGPIELCGNSQVFKTFFEVDKYLKENEGTFNSDKHDITLLYRDGSWERIVLVCKNPKSEFYNEKSNSLTHYIRGLYERGV